MTERFPTPRLRWLQAAGIALMTVGAIGIAFETPRWPQAIQAVGLVGILGAALAWARAPLGRSGRWAVAGSTLLWAFGTVLAAFAAPRFGNLLMAPAALGLGILAVGWARQGA